jgi:biotin operon repressor
MELKDLQQPNHKVLYRLLEKGWIDREEISEKMFLSSKQISCMVSTLRNKGVNIESKSHPTKYRCKMFRLGTRGDIQTRNGVNRLLVSEMNQIRILAEARLLDQELASGLIEIQYRAERALQACGLLSDSTVID